jgi:hypothetical protein
LDVSEYFILEHNSADIMNYVARHIANVPYNSKRTATRYAVFCHKNFQLQGGDAMIHMTGAESGMEGYINDIGQASITKIEGVTS